MATSGIAPAVAPAVGLLPSFAFAVAPVPADSRKLATAARCVGFGCAIPCRLLGVVVVAGNGNIPHGSHPRSGRDDSPLPPLSRLRRSARRAAGAIADDGQGLFPETPQGFFLKIDLYRLLSYLTFQQGDVLGIQSRVRASSLARKCQLTFGSPLAFPDLQPSGTELIHASHLGHTLSGVDLPHCGDLQFPGILLSGHKHCSPPFNVICPLISCLTFGVHSSAAHNPSMKSSAVSSEKLDTLLPLGWAGCQGRPFFGRSSRPLTACPAPT